MGWTPLVEREEKDDGEADDEDEDEDEDAVDSSSEIEHDAT